MCVCEREREREQTILSNKIKIRGKKSKDKSFFVRKNELRHYSSQLRSEIMSDTIEKYTPN